MSATVIPDLMPSRRTSWPGSPASSRSFSSCQIGLTMSATGRSGFGKAAAGTPDGAKSCAAPDTANAAAKTTLIVLRIVTACSSRLPPRRPLLHQRRHPRAECLRAERSAQVARAPLRVADRAVEGVLDDRGGAGQAVVVAPLAQPGKQHRRRADQRGRVGAVLARDVGRRAVLR